MMARTLFVTAWADWKDQYGGGTPGMGVDLMDVAPETPPYAFEAADKLIKLYEDANKCCLGHLLNLAKWSEKILETAPEETMAALAREFGYCMTMQALGHGVSWEDSHEPFVRKHVDFEFTCFDLDEETYHIPEETH